MFIANIPVQTPVITPVPSADKSRPSTGQALSAIPFY
jgi:hypothetical protein